MSRFHRYFVALSQCLLCALGSGTVLAEPAREYDVVVYGGTSAAVTAAVQVRQMGRSVVVVSPDKHLGGLSSGGLGWADTGNKAVIGGLARQFYHRVWKHYQQPGAWKWQRREQYGNRGQGTAAIDGERRTMWIFEPHVAEKVFDDLVREFDIPVYSVSLDAIAKDTGSVNVRIGDPAGGGIGATITTTGGGIDADAKLTSTVICESKAVGFGFLGAKGDVTTVAENSSQVTGRVGDLQRSTYW